MVGSQPAGAGRYLIRRNQPVHHHDNHLSHASPRSLAPHSARLSALSSLTAITRLASAPRRYVALSSSRHDTCAERVYTQAEHTWSRTHTCTEPSSTREQFSLSPPLSVPLPLPPSRAAPDVGRGGGSMGHPAGHTHGCEPRTAAHTFLRMRASHGRPSRRGTQPCSLQPRSPHAHRPVWQRDRGGWHGPRPRPGRVTDPLPSLQLPLQSPHAQPCSSAAPPPTAMLRPGQAR